MGHVVLTTAAGRVEINLDAEQEGVVARFLLAMIAAPGLPVPEHATSVEEAEAAQVSDPEPGSTVHGSRITNREPLLPRTCKRGGCDAVFQPAKANQDFCGQRCRKAFHNAKRTRPTPRSDIPRNIISAKVTPADRPFACKEPGCGHPCRSRGELEKHRLAWHDEKHPLPTTTEVIAALSFPCPEEGCGRVYDDENRLIHHRRVIHDMERPDVVHEVVVSTQARAVKVG